jgi:peptidase A4-like protein
MGLRASVAALLLAGALCATGSASPRARKSDNWSGYAATGAVFKSVRASWVEPVAQCFGRSAGETSSSFWVGLGGELKRSYKLEQTGTEADCVDDGAAYYFAWFELWPAESVPLSMRILPGDRITASVGLGKATVHFILDDVTRHERVSKTVEMPAPDGSSAEWIVEAPAVLSHGHHQIDPMTDFGSVRFTKASATSTNGSGSISSRGWRARVINFISSRIDPSSAISGIFESAEAAHGFPSALSPDGSSFRVVWRRGPAGGKSSPPGSA